LADELQDRYGELPAAGQLLLGSMRLRIQLKQLKIELLEYDGRRLSLSFHADTSISGDFIRQLLHAEPQRYSLAAGFRLLVRTSERLREAELIAEVRSELQRLARGQVAP